MKHFRWARAMDSGIIAQGKANVVERIDQLRLG